MLNLLKVRLNHGSQYIKNLDKAELKKPFRGFPELNINRCKRECQLCRDICPTGAIQDKVIDLGKCVFCGDCIRECPEQALDFSPFYKISTDSREKLYVTPSLSNKDYYERAIKARKEIYSIFGRSLKLRQVSAGGCDACELELNASGNPNFDMGRFGIEFVASPRHADGIVVTGPVSQNMISALKATYEAIPAPKIVIAVGACAISGGVFYQSSKVNSGIADLFEVDLFIPGCPPHPLTIINGLLRLCRIKK